MLFCICITALFIVISNATSYVIPKPSIQAFAPRGLTVSIPDSNDIRFFSFRYNINAPLSEREVRGDVSSKQANSWVYHHPNIELKRGDKIYYGIIVFKGEVEYISKEDMHEVKETISSTQENSQVQEKKLQPDSNLLCQKALVNVTQTLLELQEEISSEKDTNLILRNIIRKHPKSATTLILEGYPMHDDELDLMVQDIVNQKLKLYDVRVMSVTRKKNGKIRFQVLNLDDKLAVIKAAKEKLKNSNFKISC